MPDKASNITDSNEGWETVVEPYPETYAFDIEANSILLGTYTGSKTIQQPNLQTGVMEDRNIYTVKDAFGKNWGVWGSYSIDEAFSKISTGMEVRIQFHGIEKIDGGKREVKKYTVQSRAPQS